MLNEEVPKRTRTQLIMTMEDYQNLDNKYYQQLCREKKKILTNIKVVGISRRMYRSFVDENFNTVYLTIDMSGPKETWRVNQTYCRYCRLCEDPHYWDTRTGEIIYLNGKYTQLGHPDIREEPCERWVLESMMAEGLLPFYQKK